jgi:hypothetical protein
MPHIDFMALTAADNRELYLALVLVTATAGPGVEGLGTTGLGKLGDSWVSNDVW